MENILKNLKDKFYALIDIVNDIDMIFIEMSTQNYNNNINSNSKSMKKSKKNIFIKDGNKNEIINTINNFSEKNYKKNYGEFDEYLKKDLEIKEEVLKPRKSTKSKPNINVFLSNLTHLNINPSDFPQFQLDNKLNKYRFQLYHGGKRLSEFVPKFDTQYETNKQIIEQLYPKQEVFLKINKEIYNNAIGKVNECEKIKTDLV